MRVEQKPLLIGRSPECGLRLNDPAVSLLHAAIIPLQDGSWMVARQRSAQLVLVDGMPVDKAPLRGGETIEVGGFAIVFRLEDGREDASGEETIEVHPAVASPAEQPTAALIFQADGLGAGRVSLDRPLTVFGRGEECDVVLDDQLCSRKHAEVHRVGMGFVLRDLGSTNGVLVNGQRTDAAVELRDGDVIQMGGVIMRFSLELDMEPKADPATMAVAVAVARSLDRPFRATGLRGMWLRSPAIVQVGLTFTVAVLISLTLMMATASSRKSSVQSRSVATRPTVRDRVPERESRDSSPDDVGNERDQAAAEPLPPRTETTTDDVSKTEESGQDAASDDSGAPASDAPRVISRAKPERATGRSRTRTRSEDDQGDVEPSGRTGKGSPPKRDFADLARPVDGAPSSSGSPRPSSSQAVPREDAALPVAGKDSETTPPKEPPPGRLPVPADADINEASESIRTVFAEELSGPGNVDQTLAKLLDAARRSAKPASRFALLLAAERKALQASAFRRACEVINTRADMFEIDSLQSRLSMLRDVSKGAGDIRAEVFDIVAEVTEEAIDAERFDVASKAVSLASTIATGIEQNQAAKSSGRRVEAVRQLKQNLVETKKLHQKYSQAREVLHETPDNAKALEMVGKYLCFVKADWQEGLRALAAGSETALQELAARELAVPADRETDTMKLFSLAADWWAFAENIKRVDDLPTGSGDLVRTHAAGIYERIVGRLDDPIEAELAKKRISAAGLTK